MTNDPKSENPFEHAGADYAHHRPTWPPEIASALASLAAGSEHVLDVGCGNGQLSILLAEYFTRVTATDPSASQIAHAFSHPRIDYRCEAAESIGLEDASVDLLCAAQAAHWFDLDPFFAEARRVLRPGAPIALLSYGVPRMEGPIGERYEHFYWREILRFWPEGRRHVENGYSGLHFPFRELAVPPLTIERDWDLEDFLGYMGTWSALREAEKAGAAHLFAGFASDLRALWGDPRTARRITWPIAGRIGRA